MAKDAKDVQIDFPIAHTVTVKQDADKKNIMTTVDVAKKDLMAWYDTKGVSQEVLETIANAENTLMKEAFPALANLVVANQAPAEMRLGKGDGMMKFTVAGKKTVSAEMPKKGETAKTKDIYGRMGVSITRKVPLALRVEGGMAEEIETTVRKGWKK